MLGNRGGKFHTHKQTLAKRRWASHHWICCELNYKDMHHEPMGRGYTSLFFLDEVTAFAAGHRPCFFCRRKEASDFVRLSAMSTNTLDRQLHTERMGTHQVAQTSLLPDGAMVVHDSECYAIKNDLLLHWTFNGYDKTFEKNVITTAILLTPPTIVGILQDGFKPRWHPSAQTWETR
jgi:hypothetical protein